MPRWHRRHLRRQVCQPSRHRTALCLHVAVVKRIQICQRLATLNISLRSFIQSVPADDDTTATSGDELKFKMVFLWPLKVTADVYQRRHVCGRCFLLAGVAPMPGLQFGYRRYGAPLYWPCGRLRFVDSPLMADRFLAQRTDRRSSRRLRNCVKSASGVRRWVICYLPPRGGVGNQYYDSKNLSMSGSEEFQFDRRDIVLDHSVRCITLQIILFYALLFVTCRIETCAQCAYIIRQ